ncbi:MAG: YegS/Rv2252/BmrU family lipid kinase [Bacilli bacterium]
MKKCVIIYNSNSGKGIKRETLNKLLEIVKKKGYDVEAIQTKYHGHAIQIVSSLTNIDLLLSIGGDGTCNEVVYGNLKRKERILMSHIPLGTTNDIGSMFGLTKNIFHNLNLILDGEIKKIDICTINDRPFVYVAGFGKFMNVPYETPRDLKKRLGYIAYLIEGIKAFNDKTKSYEISFTVNGEEYKGFYSFIIISSANRIAGINNFYKDVKLDDHKFEVLLCNITKKSDIIKSIYYLKTHDITKIPGFYFYKTDTIKFKFKSYERANWCIDGEELESLKKEFEIKIVSNFTMLLPKTIDENLFI